MATLAPKAVSPFIKFCRWSALLVGVGYGAMRYSYLQKKEVGIQEHENAVKARISEKRAKAKLEYERQELISLGKECGIPEK